MLVWHISGLQISLQPFRVCHRQGALFVPMPEPATNLYPGTYPCVQLRALFPGNREKYFYHFLNVPTGIRLHPGYRLPDKQLPMQVV